MIEPVLGPLPLAPYQAEAGPGRDALRLQDNTQGTEGMMEGLKELDGSEASPTLRAPEWAPKREWWLSGSDFLVVVKHHINKYSENPGDQNRWNVYAYVYPKHWHFAAFSGESLFQDAACALPLHAGPSFCRIHRDEKGITAYQVGSDYDHLHDERFREETPEEHFPNGTVFQDAKRLFDWLASPAARNQD